MESNSLIGTWELLSYEHEMPTGDRMLPLGELPKGRIIYGADGQMSVLMTAAGRPNIGWRWYLGGTPDERAETYDGIVGYAGSYHVAENDVVHHVDVSTIPAFAGADLHRSFSLQGDELQLSVVSPAGGKSTLTWRRLA